MMRPEDYEIELMTMARLLDETTAELARAVNWIIEHAHEDDLVRALRNIGLSDKAIKELTE